MTTLSTLVATEKKRKRIGRGGSRGGTAGRGYKGQKARSGAHIGVLFEGGQMPLHRRLPKRGFSNARFADEFEVINLDRLELSFENGAEVTKVALHEKGLISRATVLVKILGSGNLSKKLIVHADASSKSAAQAIAKLGGEVRVTKER